MVEPSLEDVFPGLRGQPYRISSPWGPHPIRLPNSFILVYSPHSSRFRQKLVCEFLTKGKDCIVLWNGAEQGTFLG